MTMRLSALSGFFLFGVTLLGMFSQRVAAQDLGVGILSAPLISLRPEERPVATFVTEQPDARWDDRANGAAWTAAVLAGMRTAPEDLSAIVPRDIGNWCPAYPGNPPELRRAFWVGLISALVHHESFYDQRTISGGNAWFGLMQISPGTARHYGCDVTSGQALLNGADNLQCAVEIMSQTVARDEAVSYRDTRWRGVAADWGPMTQTRKREDMMAWVNAQDYCQVTTAVAQSLRPLGRPVVEVPGLTLLAASTMNDPGVSGALTPE